MQEVIKFRLKGASAIFRKPESNNIYFTYNNVHKIIILGILGSIIGENGYNYNMLFKDKAKELPEFYKNLSNIKIAVKPNTYSGSFVKGMQSFNNSVGYANINDKVPTTLIVDEQWLENPSWDIYILGNETEQYEKIKEYLINQKCEYIPYLGKNDHFADISEVEILNADRVEDVKRVKKINSIFCDIEFERIKEIDLAAFVKPKSSSENKFIFKEVMPTKLDSVLGYIDYKEFVFTNYDLDIKESTDQLYQLNNEIMFFF